VNDEWHPKAGGGAAGSDEDGDGRASRGRGASSPQAGPQRHGGNRSRQAYRPNVGMIVFNKEFKVFMGRRTPIQIR